MSGWDSWDDPRLIVHLDPRSIGADGYPLQWHETPVHQRTPLDGDGGGVKHLIRELNGYRCERCQHPFPPGSPGEWSPCDALCSHKGPVRVWRRGARFQDGWHPADARPLVFDESPVEAQWRILTVHHLTGVKHDLRWWNLAALCQRCHLTIQGKTRMERRFLGAHSEWFKPHAAGWYAWQYLGVDLSRDDTIGRLDELLALEHRQRSLW